MTAWRSCDVDLRVRFAALLAVLLSVLAISVGAAYGELVILSGGGILKVDGSHREGDRLRLLLPSGGVLTVPVMRVERVVADEIENSPTAFSVTSNTQIPVLDFAEGQSIPATPFGQLIYDTARRHALNPELIAAIVRAESAFDPHAVSSKGASGLLQLMPATAQRFGLDAGSLFDPEKNLDAGVRYLRWLSERFAGDLTLVLAGYNAGEATVDRYGGVPPFKETRDYIRRVYSVAGE